jgi:hypothetical protein
VRDVPNLPAETVVDGELIAARIGHSPTVKFGLHPRHPPERILTETFRGAPPFGGASSA